ncbi:hypothetical protein AALO_G00282590 [Alosa alosa]|uniref:Uncharacterized protein n=1 Tax=Alosa alosa TaxID=278164 RepID=A0AAV6FMT1_9TELE|nr:hypothetical protein AALO_G00282590 [Alosa alosa]
MTCVCVRVRARVCVCVRVCMCEGEREGHDVRECVSVLLHSITYFSKNASQSCMSVSYSSFALSLFISPSLHLFLILSQFISPSLPLILSLSLSLSIPRSPLAHTLWVPELTPSVTLVCCFFYLCLFSAFISPSLSLYSPETSPSLRPPVQPLSL